MESLRESGRRKIVKTLLLRALPVIKISIENSILQFTSTNKSEVGDPSAAADLLAPIVTPFKALSVTVLTMASRFRKLF